MEPNNTQQTRQRVDNELMSFLAPLEKELNTIFYDKAPRLPKGLCEFLVMIAPYFTVVGVILLGIALLGMIGVGTLGLPVAFFAAPTYAFNYWVYAVVAVIAWLLRLASIPGLFARSKQGWNFMFYGVLWGGIVDLVSANFFGLVVGLALGFYFLFQLRPYYVHAIAAPKA